MPRTAKPTRAEDIYNVLRSEIRSNTLAPGYQAPEPELALRLGVSRTTVREALIRLEAEGLVELIPRRGARVLPIRADDMKEIYEILTVLEPEVAGKLAASNPTQSELAPLASSVQRMEEALKQNNLDAWAEADNCFHLDLLDLHGNRRLRSFVSALNDQVHRARMVTLRLRDAPVQSNKEHRDILKALSDGDGKAAKKAFQLHRERAARELLDILDRSGIGQL